MIRICHLLEVWIQDYPHDFAVGKAGGALNALVKSIVSKIHLLHYASDFIPFLESRPLTDKDAAWALKLEEVADESEDTYSIDEDDDTNGLGVESPVSSTSPPQLPTNGQSNPPAQPISTRERKSSLPLTAKALVTPNINISTHNVQSEVTDMSPKQVLKELQKLSQDVYLLDPSEVAQEITRIEIKLFLQIEVCLI